jgi:hypothetical protein
MHTAAESVGAQVKKRRGFIQQKEVNMIRKKTTAKKKVRRSPPVPPSSTISVIWFQQQFDKLNASDALILKRIAELNTQNKMILSGVKKILDALGASDSNVIPELESIVNEVSARAVKIDEQVPDKNVPPTK